MRIVLTTLYMLSRLVIKRFCHTHGRSKCYENTHKLDSLRQEVNEIKEMMRHYEQPLSLIYKCSVLSFTGVIALVLTKL